jgi:hypothetical protein
LPADDLKKLGVARNFIPLTSFSFYSDIENRFVGKGVGGI